MIKTMLASTMAFVSTTSTAWTQRPNLPIESCSIHSPHGFATSDKQGESLCRQGYLSVYDSAAKIPMYVAYTLTPEHALGCVPRSNAFSVDKNAVNSATPEDYSGTGYDRGHNAPDGDMSWDTQVEYESFFDD